MPMNQNPDANIGTPYSASKLKRLYGSESQGCRYVISNTISPATRIVTDNAYATNRRQNCSAALTTYLNPKNMPKRTGLLMYPSIKLRP